MHLLQVKKN